MREQPVQTYYPAARLRLIVRLEDFGADDAPRPPERPPHLREKKQDAAALRVVERGGVLLLLGPGDDEPGSPAAHQKREASSDGRTHSIDCVVPTAMTISRNGVRIADTMTATIRFADLPIDPRAIRACAVEAYVGTLSPDEFARAYAGAPPADRDAPGAPLVLPDEFTDAYNARRSNLRFSGWVDSFEDDLGDDSSPPTITIECTDNTRLLIEQDAPPKLAVAAALPIDRAIAEYLAAFPQFRGLAVEYRPAGSEPPRLEAALGKTAYKPKLGPTPAGNGSSKLTVWDYLTDVCGAVGHFARVEGTTIVLQRARTLYGSTFSGRPDDPFVGRVLPGGRELQRRLFIYGRNVTKPRFRREFSRVAPFNVEVRSYDPAQKRTLVARFPTKEDRQARALPGDGGAEQAWRVIPVHGITNEATLRSIAQGIYESVGRNELSVEFETRSLGSYGGSNFDPDALDCMAGDAVDVEIVRDFDRRETVGAAEDQIASRPAEFLRELGFGDGFARAYAAAISNVGLTTTFRVKALTIDWDVENGISLAFSCANYVEVRGDKSLPPGEEPQPEFGQPLPVRVSGGEEF